MKKLVGKVIKVFIPSLDVDQKIGFQVKTDEGIFEIIEDQTEENASIYKDDLVMLTFRNVSSKEFIDISLLEEGDLDEEWTTFVWT